jgi:hypothetical protein
MAGLEMRIGQQAAKTGCPSHSFGNAKPAANNRIFFVGWSWYQCGALQGTSTMNPPKKLIPSNRNLILIGIVTVYGTIAAVQKAQHAWDQAPGPLRNLWIVLAAGFSLFALGAFLVFVRLIILRFRQE